jgi:hypothetical protein
MLTEIRPFAPDADSFGSQFSSVSLPLPTEFVMNIKALPTMILLVSVSVVGCTNPSSDPVPSDAAIVMDDMPPALDNHAHPEHGPHGGELIELGKEAFHAELVHGNEGVTIFLLDSSASAVVAIASEKLTASLKHEGQVKAFDFAASPFKTYVKTPSKTVEK